MQRTDIDNTRMVRHCMYYHYKVLINVLMLYLRYLLHCKINNEHTWELNRYGHDTRTVSCYQSSIQYVLSLQNTDKRTDVIYDTYWVAVKIRLNLSQAKFRLYLFHI